MKDSLIDKNNIPLKRNKKMDQIKNLQDQETILTSFNQYWHQSDNNKIIPTKPMAFQLPIKEGMLKIS